MAVGTASAAPIGQENALEETGGITVAAGDANASIKSDANFGNVLDVNGSWIGGSGATVPVKAVGFFKDSAPFASSAWTLNMDVKNANVNEKTPDGNADKMPGLAFGTPDKNLNVMLYSGKLIANGVTANMTKHPTVGAWSAVSIVYSESSTTGSVAVYLDGEQVLAPTAINYKLSEQSDGKAYLGHGFKTSFVADGLYDNVTVKTTADTSEQAKEETGNRIATKYQASMWDGVSIPESTESGITLPTQDALGGAITWTSSEPSVMANNGQVVKNPSKETEVTMTASVTAYGKTFTKDFKVKVAAGIADAKQAAERLLVDYQLIAGAKLPTTISGASDAKVSWKSANTKLVSDDGTVIGAEGDKAQGVDLTATVTLNDATATRTFKAVQVMPKNAAMLASYTRDGSVNGGYRVANSLHMALNTEGDAYTALNQNYGVVFAEAKITKNETLNDKGYPTETGVIRDLTDPYLFRMADGKYAYVAISTDTSNKRLEAGKILFGTSDDLVQWSGKPNDDVIDQLRTVTTDAMAFDAGSLTAGYDAATGNYRIGWKVNGVSKYVTTEDFSEGSFSEVKNGPAFAKVTPDLNGISNAIASNAMPLDKATANKLAEKLGRVSNTSVKQNLTLEVTTADTADAVREQITGTKDDGSAITLKNGNLSKGVTAEATYSDGSTFDYRVNWNADDLAKISTSEPGTYTINGTIHQQNFSDGTMMASRADPNVVYYKGKYYFMGTSDVGGQSALFIRSADTMEGLKDNGTGQNTQGGWNIKGQDHFLWGATDSTGHESYHWAPELHEINGKLYCFIAMRPTTDNDGSNKPYQGPGWMGPAAYVMELKEGGDPLKTADWIEHRTLNKDGDHLSDKGLNIDMTYFEVGGKSYIAWSQGPEKYAGEQASLYIATTDPDKPWQATSTPVRIARPEYGWDLSGPNEGPNVLVNDGKVYMVFSGQGVGPQYATGMLIADEGADLTNPSVWTKSNYPWMHNGVFPGQYGLGHNSYFTDPYGDVYNVYHFTGQNGGTRNASIVPVHFRTDGSPILDLKTSEELDQSKKNVTLTVKVVQKAVEPTSAVTVDGEPVDVNVPIAKKVGDVVALSVSMPGDGEVKWASSNESVAKLVDASARAKTRSVAAKQNVRMVGAGEAKVTATQGKTSVAIVFKVSDNSTVPPATDEERAPLQSAVDAAKPDSDASKYTAESWKAYQDVLAAAKSVLADSSATKAQVDEALKALLTAEAGLKAAGSSETPEQPGNGDKTDPSIKPTNKTPAGDASTTDDKSGAESGAGSLSRTGVAVAAVAGVAVLLSAAGVALTVLRKRRV